MAVTDLWHKTLVYFGMADDPDDWVDEYEDETETRPPARERRSDAQEDLERSYRERPNVRRLGPRRRDGDFDDIFAEESPRSSRPVMRSVESRPQPAEVHLVVPKSFNDAQQ